MSEHTPELSEKPDSWHRHTAGEGLPQHEHAATVSYGWLAFVFVFIIAVVVVLCTIVWMYFSGYKTTLMAERQEGIPAARVEFEKTRDLAGERLGSYGWIDREAGVVHIPVDAAAERVIAEYARRGGGA